MKFLVFMQSTKSIVIIPKSDGVGFKFDLLKTIL